MAVAQALRVDIGLACDLKSRRIAWNSDAELTAAVDALAV